MDPKETTNVHFHVKQNFDNSAVTIYNGLPKSDTNDIPMPQAKRQCCHNMDEIQTNFQNFMIHLENKIDRLAEQIQFSNSKEKEKLINPTLLDIVEDINEVTSENINTSDDGFDQGDVEEINSEEDSEEDSDNDEISENDSLNDFLVEE